MSMFEKVVILGSLAGMGVFSGYYLIKNRRVKLTGSMEEFNRKRRELLSNPNIKVLYSTMTLFYLQGRERNDLKSLFNFHDVLEISNPGYVALPISETDFKDRYQPVINTKQYPDMMKKIEYNIKVKSNDLITALPEGGNIDDASNLYAYDYCLRKRCKILYADRPEGTWENELEARKKLMGLIQESQKEAENLSDLQTASGNKTEKEVEREILYDRREEYFVDTVMAPLKPKFSLTGEKLHNTIVGVTQPEHIAGISKLWMSKFKSIYGHQIVEETLEDEPVSEVTKTETQPQVGEVKK